MANYANLEAAIVAAVYENANNEITGAALQSVLLQMVSSMGKSGMLCNGVADGSTTPPVNPDSNIFYIAPTGTYPNFGGLVVADGEWAIFIYNGSWQKQSVPVVTADAVPTTGSTNPVQSGGVADALEQKADIDGYYSTLTAGAAENLVGRGSVLAEYTRRTSGGSASIGSGAATIEKIHGNSVAWNQLADNFVAYNSASITTSGTNITVSNTNSNAVMQIVTGNSLPMVNGHKYIFYNYTAQIVPATISSTQTVVYNGSVQQSPYTNLVFTYTGATDTCTVIWQFTRTDPSNPTSFTIPVPNIYDLTLMFGAGNEPTYDDFKKLFPLNYYAYNTGSLLSLTGTGIETNGFNQWDMDALFTGAAGLTKVADGWQGQASAFWNGGLPYWENTIGYTGQMCIYMKATANSSGGNFRFQFYYTDGSNSNAVQLSGMSIESYATSTAGKVVSYIIANYGSERTITINKLCLNFSWSGYRDGEYEAYWDSTLAMPITTVTSGGSAVFADGMKSCPVAYDELTATKAIKRCDKRAYTAGDESDSTVITDGTNTIYALTTPVEYTLDSEVNLNYRVDDFGTETLLPQNNATPTTAPIVYDVRYAMNAVDTLRNLPTNYISKDSLKNLLDAFVSAGVISAYTMTYNAGTEQYTFTITA